MEQKETTDGKIRRLTRDQASAVAALDQMRGEIGIQGVQVMIATFLASFAIVGLYLLGRRVNRIASNG